MAIRPTICVVGPLLLGAWAGGKEEEEKVHQLLFDPDKSGVKSALRRRASDLAGWPEVNRIVNWVELDFEAQHLYKLATIFVPRWSRRPVRRLAVASHDFALGARWTTIRQ
jgi:hypothetical protein